MLKIRFEPPVGTETLEQADQLFRRLFVGSQIPTKSGTRYIGGSAIEYQLQYRFKASKASECLTVASDAPDIIHTKDGKCITIQEREQIFNSYNHDVHNRSCQCCGTARSDYNVEWHDVEDRSITDFFVCCHVCVEKWMPK